jgi:hypothetical protein
MCPRKRVKTTSYVFNVRGTDEFGTKDGTPATRAFTLVP